jgi:hypothetical protein
MWGHMGLAAGGMTSKTANADPLIDFLTASM